MRNVHDEVTLIIMYWYKQFQNKFTLQISIYLNTFQYIYLSYFYKTLKPCVNKVFNLQNIRYFLYHNKLTCGSQFGK